MKNIFENVKGTFDYLPEKQIVRERIKDTLKKVFEKYGFAPIETPIICMYDLLASKYSEGADILNETYKLTDQGKRNLGLRYDLTITFSKLISSNPDIILPFKRYEIGRVYRDGPVKLGRNREFTQCDIDVVGNKSVMAEAEFMLMSYEGYSNLGIDIEIEFNNRKLLSGIIETVLGKIDESLNRKCIILIDKLAKLTHNELIVEFEKIGIAKERVEELTNYFSLSYNELKEKLSNNDNTLVIEGLKEIEELLSYLEDTNAIDRMKFAPYLARGIDIYTGTVWEIFLKDKKLNGNDFNLSIGSGGRYDKIITSFIDDGNIYPAVGMSFGLDVIYEVLSLKATNEESTMIKLYVIPFGTNKEAFKFVSKLRDYKIKADMEKDFTKLKKSLNYANRMKIPFVIVLGENEIKSGVIKIKNMATGEETECKIDDYSLIADIIK